MKLAPLLLILLALPALSATLYRWTDTQGQVHYTDQPPPPEVKKVSQKDYKGGSTEGAVSPEQQLVRLRHPVTLYLTADCGSPCERARAHLARRGIPYTSKDALADQEAGDLLREKSANPQTPTLFIGSEMLESYNQAAWDAALDKAGYPPDSKPTKPAAAPKQASRPPAAN